MDINASFGIALFPDHGNDMDTLMQRAEVAMYAAKKEKAGLIYYDKKYDQYSSKRLTLMAELRQVILVISFSQVNLLSDSPWIRRFYDES